MKRPPVPIPDVEVGYVDDPEAVELWRKLRHADGHSTNVEIRLEGAIALNLGSKRQGDMPWEAYQGSPCVGEGRRLRNGRAASGGSRLPGGDVVRRAVLLPLCQDRLNVAPVPFVQELGLENRRLDPGTRV